MSVDVLYAKCGQKRALLDTRWGPSPACIWKIFLSFSGIHRTHLLAIHPSRIASLHPRISLMMSPHLKSSYRTKPLPMEDLTLCLLPQSAARRGCWRKLLGDDSPKWVLTTEPGHSLSLCSCIRLFHSCVYAFRHDVQASERSSAAIPNYQEEKYFWFGRRACNAGPSRLLFLMSVVVFLDYDRLVLV